MKNKLLLLLLVLGVTGCSVDANNTEESVKKTNNENESISTSDINETEKIFNKEEVTTTTTEKETVEETNNTGIVTTNVVDSCDISGSREANAIVDIGYDSDYATRDYYAYTNEYGQLVKVTADEIILQNDDEENNGEERYCADEAKVPGVKSSNLDEGHAIADSLGGVSNAYNITPQESYLNRYGAQADMEGDIRAAGGAEDFVYTIKYDDTSTQIPSSYSVSYVINGKTYTDSYDNDYTEDDNNEDENTSTESNNEGAEENDVTYANCSAVRDAGAAPIHKGDPGYSSKLDRDGDGVACE